MPRLGNIRIPAALAAASAATVHFLQEAGKVIHLPALFGARNVGEGSRPHSSKPGSGGDKRVNTDDLH